MVPHAKDVEKVCRSAGLLADIAQCLREVLANEACTEDTPPKHGGSMWIVLDSSSAAFLHPCHDGSM
eukprot:6460608-Amphidinium_carterae.2